MNIFFVVPGNMQYNQNAFRSIEQQGFQSVKNERHSKAIQLEKWYELKTKESSPKKNSTEGKVIFYDIRCDDCHPEEACGRRRIC